ncbi:MAG: hypothetical protein ACC656_00440 [Candidatus Heimdallarchaeota archaeon]
MEISNLIGKTLKKRPAREYIDSFKMLIRGGFVKVLEDNAFVFTSTLNGSIEKLYSMIIKHFHDYNVVSIYPKFSNDSLFDFLNSEISSYKQLPLRIRYQTIGENKKYYMKLGLLYPQNSLILGFSLIMSGKDEIELEQKN